jgi:hypothetical protein
MFPLHVPPYLSYTALHNITVLTLARAATAMHACMFRVSCTCACVLCVCVILELLYSAEIANPSHTEQELHDITTSQARLVQSAASACFQICSWHKL